MKPRATGRRGLLRHASVVVASVFATIGLVAPGALAEEPDTAAADPHAIYLTGAGIIDTSDRDAVAAAYTEWFAPLLATPIEWTGSLDTCEAGDTSLLTRDATLAAVNYFRASAGLGPVATTEELNALAQAAALSVAANRSLSHTPAPGSACSSELVFDGALNANLCLGCAGPDAIAAYMADAGDANTDVGHRRWILYPPQQLVGSGSVPGDQEQPPAQALYVLHQDSWDRAAGPEGWVSWPAAGYTPYQLVPKRFSLSLGAADGDAPHQPGGADFSNAVVSVQEDGFELPVTIVAADGIGARTAGDRAIVFEPDLADVRFGPDEPDRTLTVTVSGIIHGEREVSHTYEVIVFDPELVLCEGRVPTIVGTPDDDELLGTPGPDVIVGLGGDDTIVGADGDDLICAGPGNDTVAAGAGADHVHGASGDDTIRGGPGADQIFGGTGIDRLRGNGGNDTIAGGAGPDNLLGGPGADALYGTGGKDILDGGLGRDTLHGGGGEDQCITDPDDHSPRACEVETVPGTVST